MEDAADAVEAAIGSGAEAQKAVNDIVGSQDWYIELSPKLKQQFNEILQDEFGATPKAQPKAKAPAAKPATKGGTDIQNIVDNYYKLKDGDRSARAAINEILDADPKLKYIYNNISKINKQLQDAGVITEKTDGCP
jgi:lipopolysaccharide biosynthesis regulator YciM